MTASVFYIVIPYCHSFNEGARALMSRQNDVYCMGRPARSSLPIRLAEKYSSQQCNVVTDRSMVSTVDKPAEADLL